MSVVLIGQAPSRTSDPERPLSGEALARKLCDLASLTREEYLALDRVNLLTRWPGSAEKGDLFPAKLAREGAERLAPSLKCKRVLFLGRGVANAFGFREDFLTRRPWNGGEAAILPHPSGVNLWYNDAENRRRAASFFRAFLRSEACNYRFAPENSATSPETPRNRVLRGRGKRREERKR